MQEKRSEITYFVFALLCLSLFLLDRVSKLWASNLSVSSRPDSFLAVYPAYNEKGFLGLIPGLPGLPLLLVSLLLLSWIVFTLRDEITSLLLLSFALFFAGIFGNSFDRIAHGHVVDWIYIHPGFILNLADLFVFFALLLLFTFLLQRPRLEQG
jgi:lipoprotein signal peptidase